MPAYIIFIGILSLVALAVSVIPGPQKSSGVEGGVAVVGESSNSSEQGSFSIEGHAMGGGYKCFVYRDKSGEARHFSCAGK